MDIKHAVECLIIAAATSAEHPKGDVDAQNMLGELYETGEGTESDEGPNYEKAILYYKKAVTQGHPRAMFNLGALYETGLGVDNNLNLAIKLYNEVWLELKLG